MKQKLLSTSLLFVFIASALTYFSYRHAITVADEIMKPMSADWGYYNTGFLPVGFKDRKDGPSWLISYDANEAMVVHPISIQVSLFGKVLGTNPPDLRERTMPVDIKSKERSGEHLR